MPGAGGCRRNAYGKVKAWLSKTDGGVSVLRVEYSGAILDYDQAIEAGYRLFGLKPGSVAVIATPVKADGDGDPGDRQRQLFSEQEVTR